MDKKSLEVIAGSPDSPLIIGESEIPCYVLEDETRVLSQRGVHSALATKRGGPHSDTATRKPRFMATKALSAFIADDLKSALENPVCFMRPGAVA